MFCCSPDVGDCPHCHPEMWIKNSMSPWNWVSRFNINRSNKANKRYSRGGKRFSRKTNTPSRPQVRLHSKVRRTRRKVPYRSVREAQRV